MVGIFRRCRHPFVSFLFFFCTVSLCVAVKHPLYLALSLSAALLMNLLLKNWQGLRSFSLLIPFFLILSCFNPLVSHWGSTVLFSLFGDSSKPVTLEAVCYGLNNALMLVTVVLWFLAFSRVITAEKLTFLFAPLFPAIAIMLVMIFRMVPFYRRRALDISEGRQGLGLEKGSSLCARLREKMLVLSAVTSSTLEEGKITADSMTARYWGRGKRTSFLTYRLGSADLLLTFCCLALTALCVLALTKGAGAMNFYPVIDAGSFRGNCWNCLGLGSAFSLGLLLAFFCRS